jgi:hypothetical protein
MRTFSAEGPLSPSLRAYMVSIGQITGTDGLLHHDLQKVAVHEISNLDRNGMFRPSPSMVTDAIVTSEVVMFHMYGRQVFHLDDALADELAQTDVDDVPPSDVHAPHIAFYLTIGGRAAEEAGLSDVQGLLVTSEESASGYLNITAMRVEEGKAIALGTGHIDLDVGTTMAEALDDAAADVQGSDPTTDLSESAHPNNAVIREGFRLHTLSQIAGMERLRKAIRLLVNAMLYIDTAGAGRRRGWHPDTPADLVQRAEGNTGAAKAEQRLAREGWTRVTIMTLEDGNAAQDEGTGATRRTHWRRGHWRRQHHGPARSLIKRIRIRPVRVVGRAGGEVEGHEYILPDRND